MFAILKEKQLGGSTTHHPQYSDLQTCVHNPSHTQGVHPVSHIFTALCLLSLHLIIQILAGVAAIHPARCLEVCTVSSTVVSCLLSLQMLLIAINLLKDISSTLFFITCQNSRSEKNHLKALPAFGSLLSQTTAKQLLKFNL